MGKTYFYLPGASFQLPGKASEQPAHGHRRQDAASSLQGPPRPAIPQNFENKDFENEDFENEDFEKDNFENRNFFAVCNRSRNRIAWWPVAPNVWG